jgi:hypothetical protein
MLNLEPEDFFDASIYIYNGHGNGIKLINKIFKEKKVDKMEILFGDKLYENEKYYFQIKTLISGGQQMSVVLVNKK